MDFANELTRMAELELDSEDMDLQDKIIQWQKLFGYSYDEALRFISNRYSDFDRTTISTELWDEIKEDWISKGYDKDAYEHHLEFELRASNITLTWTQDNQQFDRDNPKPKYLMRLDKELSDPVNVAAILGIQKLPETTCDIEDPSIRFCFLTNAERQIIESKVFPKPAFISLGAIPSAKDLNTHSQHPTLGIESTLPQHRAEFAFTAFEPKQDQYPVWYFFYGNLAKPKILSSRLGIPEESIRYIPAMVYGGRLATWRNKYRALLDGKPEEFVQGYGFMVELKEVEDWLRAYETEAYEVVRCRMELDDGRIVPACTFRFALSDHT